MKIHGIYEVQHKNPEVFGPHTHTYHELVYCIKGNGNAEIHGKRKPFRTGSYYVTHAGTRHTEYDDFPCQIIYFYFSSPQGKVIEGIYTDHNGAILSIIQRLLLESQSRFAETTEMQNCLLQQILILVRRMASGEMNRDMAAILQYVHEHSEQEIDFRQLAAKQNYSYDHFRHLFQEYTGMPPHQYVLMKRLERCAKHV